MIESVESNSDQDFMLSMLAQVPLALPSRFRKDDMFVNDMFVAAACDEVLHLAVKSKVWECITFCPIVPGLHIRPLFKWCPLLPSYTRDIVHGQPTDQSAVEWDFPCGIQLARNVDAIYAGVDRSVKSNAAWRMIDPDGWLLAVKTLPGGGKQYLLACVKVNP